MKALKPFWASIRALFQREAKKAEGELSWAAARAVAIEARAIAAEEKLQASAEQHLADLRLLLDHAHDRERELAGMVRMVMEERFYRPTITNKAPGVNAISPALPIETLADVATFDESADQKTIAAHDAHTADLEHEFNSIAHEETEYRASRESGD